MTDETTRFEAYVFDAYGTLFDVHSAVYRHAGAIGPQHQTGPRLHGGEEEAPLDGVLAHLRAVRSARDHLAALDPGAHPGGAIAIEDDAVHHRGRGGDLDAGAHHAAPLSVGMGLDLDAVVLDDPFGRRARGRGDQKR